MKRRVSEGLKQFHSLVKEEDGVMALAFHCLKAETTVCSSDAQLSGLVSLTEASVTIYENNSNKIKTLNNY